MEEISPNNILEVSHISASYQEGKQRKTVLHDISFELHENEILGLVGESGCGKSTLSKVILGFIRPDEGEIISQVDHPQMIFQDPFSSLNPAKKISWILEEPLRMQKVPKEERKKRVLAMAERVGLSAEHLKRRPHELSGGQRQRVALGRAMVRNPAVFLLDEPLSNLDAKLRTSMRTEIIKLHKKLATTFIYVTHDQTEAMTMGDRIVVMKDGIIQQVDTPQNLYDMPCNMFVAGFIGSPQMNFLDGTVIKKGDQYGIDLGGDVIPLPKEKTADGKLDSYVGKKVKMGIRPEDIDDEPEFMAKHTDCQLDAQVDVSEMMGAEIYLYLEYKGNKMTARVAPTSKARNGDKVRVAFDPHKVHLFDVETEQTVLN